MNFSRDIKRTRIFGELSNMTSAATDKFGRIDLEEEDWGTIDTSMKNIIDRAISPVYLIKVQEG